MKNKIVVIFILIINFSYSYDRNTIENKLNGSNIENSKQYKNKNYKEKPYVVYHCSAKALRASGWQESTSLYKAKQGAIRQCMIRRVSSEPCVIQTCYKK